MDDQRRQRAPDAGSRIMPCPSIPRSGTQKQAGQLVCKQLKGFYSTSAPLPMPHPTPNAPPSPHTLAPQVDTPNSRSHMRYFSWNAEGSSTSQPGTRQRAGSPRLRRLHENRCFSSGGSEQTAACCVPPVGPPAWVAGQPAGGCWRAGNSCLQGAREASGGSGGRPGTLRAGPSKPRRRTL